MDAPQYQPPQRDRAFDLLMAKSKQEDIAALGERARAEGASLQARFGRAPAAGGTTAATQGVDIATLFENNPSLPLMLAFGLQPGSLGMKVG